MKYLNTHIISAIVILCSTSVCSGWSFGDVIINELMWMGSSYSPYDEYLELRNMTGSGHNFSASSWSIYRNDELMLVINTGTMPANGYYLVSRLDTSASALNVSPDIVSSELILNNSDSQYKLYAGPDDTYTLIDIADDGSGAPPEGEYLGISGGIFWSMERDEPPGDGTLSSSWHSACLTVNFDPGAVEHGTPKASNKENDPPQWDGVDSPELALDEDDLIFNVLNCRDVDNIPDSLEAIGIWWSVGEPLPIYSATQYGIDSGDSASVILPHTFTKPGHYYTWRITLNDGQDTLAMAGTLFVHFNRRDLLIDELCWGGSSRSNTDEWLELLSTRSDTIYFEQTPIILWRAGFGGTLIAFTTLNSGFLPTGQRMLIKRLPHGHESSAVAVMPDIVSSDFTIYDGMVFVGITDLPDTGYFIDVAGNYSIPPAGIKIPGDSLWASMTRVSPSSDGSLPSSWRASTVTINFLPSSFDRGSPKAPDLFNYPPMLSIPDSVSFFTPDTGGRDTVFVFRIMYSDSDGIPPDSIVLLLDINLDGNWTHDEIFTMDIETPSPDYVSGVFFKREFSGLLPTFDGAIFTFRASDGYTIAAFPIPGEPGPVIYPTAGIELSDTIWILDSLHWMDDRFAISPRITLSNTGDLPALISLKIAVEDTFEYDGCGTWAIGGWLATCNNYELLCNRYKLSAIFTDIGVTPDTLWFNELENEDCLRPDEFTHARNDTLGMWGISSADQLPPGDYTNLWLLLNLPRFVYGENRGETHQIVIKLKCTVSLY